MNNGGAGVAPRNVLPRASYNVLLLKSPQVPARPSAHKKRNLRYSRAKLDCAEPRRCGRLASNGAQVYNTPRLQIVRYRQEILEKPETNSELKWRNNITVSATNGFVIVADHHDHPLSA